MEERKQKEIEEAICEESLPVNTLAMLRRGIVILSQADTNSSACLRGEDLASFKKLLWLLNSQIYGQINVIDMTEEWRKLCSETCL